MGITLTDGTKILGSITLDGRTQRLRVRIPVDGKRITLPGSFESEGDAIGAAAHFWSGLSASRPKTLGLKTIGEWGQECLDARETDGHHRSVDRDRSRWKAYVAGTPFAELYVDTATTDDCLTWLEALMKRTSKRTKRRLKKQTIANVLNLVRVVMESAVSKRLITVNPVRTVRLPKFATDQLGWDWLRASEINALAIEPNFTLEQRIIFVVAICTGLRKGELWGLRWVDIDFENGGINVSRSYGGPTKGGRVRYVPLIKPALDALLLWRDYGRPCDLVFPTSDVCMRSRNDNAGIVEIVRKVVPRKIRFHDLRHSCASHLLAGTWAPKWMERALRLEEIKEWLGHTKIATTERYAHLAKDAIAARVRGVKSAKPAAERGTPNLAIVQGGKAVLGHSGRAPRSGRRVDAVDADEASQVCEIVEASAGIEPALTVLQTGTLSLKVSHSYVVRRPLSVQIVELLRQYAKRRRPADELVIDALKSAAELALAHERALVELELRASAPRQLGAGRHHTKG